MSKVTILTAAYNAEAYLRPCLDSLLSQTWHDFQVICVDDGSTDSTPQILDEYAARDVYIISNHPVHHIYYDDQADQINPLNGVQGSRLARFYFTSYLPLLQIKYLRNKK